MARWRWVSAFALWVSRRRRCATCRLAHSCRFVQLRGRGHGGAAHACTRNSRLHRHGVRAASHDGRCVRTQDAHAQAGRSQGSTQGRGLLPRRGLQVLVVGEVPIKPPSGTYGIRNEQIREYIWDKCADRVSLLRDVENRYRLRITIQSASYSTLRTLRLQARAELPSPSAGRV